MWFDNLINVHSAVQGIVILSLICTLGLALGKIHVKGISLGVAFRILRGYYSGSSRYLYYGQNMLELQEESFGLTMFCVCAGSLCGSNFFRFDSRRHFISQSLESGGHPGGNLVLTLGLCWIFANQCA